MYRRYEDPRVLQDELDRYIDDNAYDEHDEDYYETVAELKERINFAWQDDEYDCDYGDRYEEDYYDYD